jgi:hypothetical protein
MKKVLLALLLATLIIGCSKEELRLEQPVNCKQELDKEFGRLVYNEAILNGWNQTASVNINTTDIFAPGFLDVNHDANMFIYFQAIDKYTLDYNSALSECSK